MRFHSLREMLEDGFEDNFLDLATVGDYDKELPIELHLWLALYAETRQGASRARFTSEAFYRNYREANSKTD